MKMKKMKNFSTWPKYFNLYFSETLNFADFKYDFRFFISFSKVGLKWAKTGKMDPLRRAVTFDRSKIRKI